MARNSVVVTISDEGRDKGKRFRITEWPAQTAEEWGLRVLLALGAAGVEIPPEILQLGGVAVIYFAGQHLLKIRERKAIRLARELMECVQICEDKLDRGVVANDIEEVATRLTLKKEALKLTYGFFDLAASLSSVQAGSGSDKPKP